MAGVRWLLQHNIHIYRKYKRTHIFINVIIHVIKLLHENNPLGGGIRRAAASVYKFQRAADAIFWLLIFFIFSFFFAYMNIRLILDTLYTSVLREANKYTIWCVSDACKSLPKYICACAKTHMGNVGAMLSRAVGTKKWFIATR